MLRKLLRALAPETIRAIDGMPEIIDPPKVRAPWWQTLLWICFQLAVITYVYTALLDANDRDHFAAQEGSQQAAGIVAVGASFLATFGVMGLLWACKKTLRLISRKQAAHHRPLPHEIRSTASGQSAGERTISSEERITIIEQRNG